MFGLPVVLNPLLMIPFISGTSCSFNDRLAADGGLTFCPVVVNVIWVMPTIISGFLATAGDWRSIVLTIVNLIVAALIWAPFILAANRLDPNLGRQRMEFSIAKQTPLI